MKPQFEDYTEGFGAALKCPSCGEDFLHHGKIETFDRSEDNEQGLHVSVERGNVSIDQDLKENPSRRRQGLCVHFTCEHCPDRSVLTISQHKGQTYVDLIKV